MHDSVSVPRASHSGADASSVHLQPNIHTEVEKPEDPVHGGLDIGRVVFQAKDEELIFVKNCQPVQKIHGIQADLEPHLGPKKSGIISGGIPPTQ